MKPIFLVLMLCFSVPVVAQNITISGKVRDKATGEELGFASVGIKGKSIGTVSNYQGEFDFHVPSEYRNEILVVSMIGYLSFESPVWALASDSMVNIRLEKSTTVLEEIVVRDSLSGGDILRIALSRIETNFPDKPFLMDGFYRDVKKVGGTYISLLEAAVKIYDEDYKEPRNKMKLRERVRLVEVRKSLGYENKFNRFFDQTNLLEDLLLNNTIRYRQIEVRDELFAAMVREPSSYYDGHDIFVVSHDVDYHLKIFIDKQDYSIIHMEYEVKPSDQVMVKKQGLVSKNGGIKTTLDFRRLYGRMYLNFIEMRSKERWHDEKTDKLEFETELYQQLLINEVQHHAADRIGQTEKMRNYGLQYQDLPYNKKFWDNYNVIKESPLDRQIRSDLEKHMSLEKQFEEN